MRIFLGNEGKLGGGYRIFLILFCPGEGKRESEAPGGGRARPFIANPSRGGRSRGRVRAGGGARDQEGVCGEWGGGLNTVRVEIITGSLVILENLFPRNYRYRYRLETQINLFNYHYRYRLGVRSHTFISIDSQLPS